MISDNQEEILSWNIEKLWNSINMLENKSEYRLEMSYIKFGYKLKVPIWYIFKEWYEVFPSSANVKILGYGKFKIWDFMEEKERRETEMRKILLENWDDESPTEARIK